MGFFGGFFGGTAASGGGGSPLPSSGNVTTAEAIRERHITVIGELTPSVHPELPFVAYRDEAGADFRRWARSHPGECTRHYQVRTVSNDRTADASNIDIVARIVTVDIIVAYAKRFRAGAGFDRDDTMESDQDQIERAVGREGVRNFGGAYPNASWLPPEARGSQTAAASYEREDADVDFLVIRQSLRFYRSSTP